jgi:hypothetical protein
MVRRRPNADPGQSVRTHWSEEDRSLNEMAPEKAAVKGMKTTRQRRQVQKLHGFLGEDLPGFPFLPPPVHYRTNAIRLVRLLYSRRPPCSIFAYGCSSCRIGLRQLGTGCILF